MTIHLEVHALEMTLNDTSTEIGHLTNGIGLHLGFRVLYHHHAVLVVSIGNGKGILGQTIEESLLGVTIVLEGFMIV